MTIPVLKIKVLPKTTVKGKMDVRFPANVASANFLTVTKSNGTYTFGVDYTLLAPTPVSDPTNSYIVYYNAAAGTYGSISVTDMNTGSLDPDLQAIAALTGTGIARRTGANAWSVGTAVANSELATMANSTFKGNVSGSTAVPSDLTAAQVAAALPVATTSAKGLAPQLPNDATKYLDGTGNYTVPAGGGGGMDPSLLRGFISGLTLSNDAVTPNTILDIAAGVATSDDQTVIMKLSSNYTKTTGSWAVGTGNGALDTGTVANNTWYHVFLTQRTDTNVVDILFSTSPTSPTMPTNYTKKRRIGAFRTNGSSQIIAFLQFGNDFLWSVPVNDYSGNNPGTSAVLATLTVPAGVTTRAKVWVYLQSADATVVRRVLLLTSTAQPDTAPVAGTLNSLSAGTPAGVASAAAGTVTSEFNVWTDTSRQIRFRLDGSGAGTSVFINTAGWTDFL